MQPADIPANEIERLAALQDYCILDTAPESDFDEITRLASFICGTPISVMSLIDTNRQWFKSRIGLDADETPRDVAFCAHTILQPDIMIVNDAHQDERFFDNPLVKSDPHIRFYAGVPLITPEGYALGSLCAMDRVPRELDPHQLEALNTLAKQVVKNMELRISHLKLREMASQLVNLNANKDRLFSLVAHDLKSPFSGVLGMLEMMAEEGDTISPAEMKDHLRMLSRSARDTFSLMENLLQWSTFESGETPYHPVRVNLDEIVCGVISLVQAAAGRKSVAVSADVPSDLYVLADKSMVHSIIQNLIANALKFTPEGGRVTVDVQVSNEWVEVSVRDTGVGMSPTQLAKIRNRESGHTSYGTRGESGTGLGLNICQRFIEKHGGRFSVQSAPGEGTTMSFTLPRAD
jgi:signal transduction histidine kinase